MEKKKRKERRWQRTRDSREIGARRADGSSVDRT